MQIAKPEITLVESTDSYPTPWELDGLMTSGESIFIRPIRIDDVDRLVHFHSSLSPETIRMRFFGEHPELSEREAARFSTIDYRDRMGVLAFAREQLIGFASFDRIDSTPRAEVAFVVSDAYQRHGVGMLMFECLAAYARDAGIEQFVAEILSENNGMRDMFYSTGLDCRDERDKEILQVVLDLTMTEEYRLRCDEREAVAEVASMSAILRPRSIAVVGAGRRTTSIGHRVFRGLLSGDYSGTVYPVNPLARSICGVPAYPSLSALPEAIDLVIVAVPAAAVPAVLAEAAECSVRASVVISAGFGEMGPAGAAVEAGILEMARRHGMRIVGPNCLGVMNTDPDIGLRATFADLEPLPGHLALATQSGAVGIVLVEQACAAGLGLSNFVSMGNKLDVSSNDLLCFFESDERTSVIALYLESLGNPRKFARIAQRVAQKKPIVALKAGKTRSGSRGARSHTAAAATPETAVTAMLKGAGVIKVDRLEELIDVSSILLTGVLPFGRRVALVGNSGGPLILTADACEMSGLVIPEFGAETKRALAQIAVPAAALDNPIDLTADGTTVDLANILDVVLADTSIDAVIVVSTDLPTMTLGDTLACLTDVARRSSKPLIACLLGPRPLERQECFVPLIPSPERAALALAHVCNYAQWRNESHPSQIASTVISQAVRDIITSHLTTHDEGWMTLDEASELLAAGGVRVVATRAAFSADEAARVATSIGFPVVLKARSGSLLHKSDIGAVVIGLESELAVAQAYTAMDQRLGTSMGGAVVQAMVSSGVEAIVGLTRDPKFGPMVMVGMGGVLTDLISDHAFGIPPLRPFDAATMVSSLRTAALLDGYRGAAPLDREALIDLVNLVAHLADEIPELAEVDLNPVIVGPAGVLAVDCKVRLAPRTEGPGALFRALRAPNLRSQNSYLKG